MNKQILILIPLLMIVVAMSGCINLPSATFFSGCTWQPDYWWVTCQSIQGSQELVAWKSFVCPTGADIDKCTILSTTAVATSHDLADCASCGFLQCSDCKTIAAGSTVERGRLINSNAVTNVQVWRKELRNCGAAACSSSGEPVSGAQGCSWKGSSLLDAFNQPVDTVSVSSSYKYVVSQHLVSCPQECTAGLDDLGCSLPIGNIVRSGTTTYNGFTVKWYASGQQVYKVGCKTDLTQTVCTKYDANRTNCLEQRPYGQCGTLSIDSAGSCVANSDCGDTTRYACKWDDASLKGTCVPTSEVIIQTCFSDYACSQTAPTCNDKIYGSSRCVLGTCQVVKETVQCCSVSDCANNYFCNAEHKCEVSQKQKAECPAGKCCEGITGIKDRLCSDMTGNTNNVCCGDQTCKKTAADCGSGNQPPSKDWLKILMGSFVAAILILVALTILSFFIRPLKVAVKPIYNVKTFIIITILLAILIFFFFAGIAMWSASLVS